MPANTNFKSNMPIFAVDNSADVEAYLFANHPTDFISLTADAKDEHHTHTHSPPLSPKSTPKSILKPTIPSSPQHDSHVTFAAPAHPTAPLIAPPMQRKTSSTSTTSEISIPCEDAASAAAAGGNDEEGYLGGGALRHVSGSHHLRDLAALAELDAQARAKREAAILHYPVGEGDDDGAAAAAGKKKVVAQAQKKIQEEHHSAGWLAMAWWPETMEMMEHEWTDEFYE